MPWRCLRSLLLLLERASASRLRCSSLDPHSYRCRYRQNTVGVMKATSLRMVPAVMLAQASLAMVLVPGLEGAASLASVCTSDLDCLGGRCINNTASRGPQCSCPPLWEGETCQTLRLRPASVRASGLRIANTSGWGGNAVQDPADGKLCKCQLLHPAPPYYPFPRGKVHTKGNAWGFTVG